jgi:hypothetical protein
MANDGIFSKIHTRLAKIACKKIERFRPGTREKIHLVIDVLFVLRRNRERVLLSKLKSSGRSALFNIEKSQGISKLNINPPLTSSAIEFARETLKNFRSKNSVRLNSKEYLQQIWNLSQIDDNSKFLLDWALQPETLNSIKEYFGKAPILHDISVFYSPERENEKTFQGSQLFHMDGGGTQSVKIWLLCEAVESENGPTVLIPSSISASIAKKISYRPGDRVKDDALLGDERNRAISLVGPAGSWFATDTDRCFHFGSRTQKASSRLVVMFHFVDNNSTYYMPFVNHHYSKKYTKIPQKISDDLKNNPYTEFVLQKRV